jgi:hypothetical protein
MTLTSSCNLDEKQKTTTREAPDDPERERREDERPMRTKGWKSHSLFAKHLDHMGQYGVTLTLSCNLQPKKLSV